MRPGSRQILRTPELRTTLRASERPVRKDLGRLCPPSSDSEGDAGHEVWRPGLPAERGGPGLVHRPVDCGKGEGGGVGEVWEEGPLSWNMGSISQSADDLQGEICRSQAQTCRHRCADQATSGRLTALGSGLPAAPRGL